MPLTNRGLYRLLGIPFRAATAPANFYLALVTDASIATSINVFSEVTEIADTNGYTAGGISVARNATDFDVWTEDDGNNRAYVQLKDMVWTASGGPIPASGSGARNAILTDANATQALREIWGAWDLTSARVISDTQTLTLTNCEIRFAQ